VVLAVRLQRGFFDEILAGAVHSTYSEEVYGSEEAWRVAIERSEARLQWDPDTGRPLERRAIQLGLRGSLLARYAREAIVSIEDISDFAREQYEHVRAGDYERLLTPKEVVYQVADEAVRARLGLEH
jgi:hypothetical protein